MGMEEEAVDRFIEERNIAHQRKKEIIPTLLGLAASGLERKLQEEIARKWRITRKRAVVPDWEMTIVAFSAAEKLISEIEWIVQNPEIAPNENYLDYGFFLEENVLEAVRYILALDVKWRIVPEQAITEEVVLQARGLQEQEDFWLDGGWIEREARELRKIAEGIDLDNL